ncbi:MAG: hypothetical protein PHS83_00045 [Clostridia bacterium]|jgi:hypothetical protein|nr:hypothetical protein [Clostridia bacterium]MDD4145495.1 hypothetical protein [Clostridia bacterium]MDD4665914.1 hypothetical protein [Clostridia bacterium]
MSHVRITLSREMLRALLANLTDLRSPAGEFIVENEIDGLNEIIRVINLVSGDVFEQTVQKQATQIDSPDECKIYEFPLKIKEDIIKDEE